MGKSTRITKQLPLVGQENAGARPGFWEVPRGLCSTSHAQIGIGVNGLSSTSHSVPPKEEPTDSGLFLKAPYQITVKCNKIIEKQETKVARVPGFLGHPHWCGPDPPSELLPRCLLSSDVPERCPQPASPSWVLLITSSTEAFCLAHAQGGQEWNCEGPVSQEPLSSWSLRSQGPLLPAPGASCQL